MNSLTWLMFGNEFFLIQKGDQGIVYAPLLGKFFPADAEGVARIKAYITNPEDDVELHNHLASNGFFQEASPPGTRRGEEYNPTELYLSLTSGCNLACSYCYARAGEDSRRLTWEKIAVSVDQLFQYAKEREEDEVEITFHGTGEATVEWKTLVKTVEYALQCLPEGGRIFFTLVTNGVLLDEEKVDFLAEHGFSVTVSVDGLKETQNQLRPLRGGGNTFSQVISAVKLLVNRRVDFGIRTTITGTNQSEMIDFVRFCDEVGCREVYLVPYSKAGRGESGIAPIDPKRFIQDYVQLLNTCHPNGINIHTLSDDLSRVSAGFCDGDGSIFAVMPGGEISSCTRVTRSDDTLAGQFFIGEVDDSKVTISNEKVSALRELNVYSFSECSDCFAKYNCAGGCHADRLTGQLSQESCFITREVLWNNLLQRI